MNSYSGKQGVLGVLFAALFVVVVVAVAFNQSLTSSAIPPLVNHFI